jgi:hypothetical protein
MSQLPSVRKCKAKQESTSRAGGQFLRAVVQRCQHTGPKMHTLITMGGQHQVWHHRVMGQEWQPAHVLLQWSAVSMSHAPLCGELHNNMLHMCGKVLHHSNCFQCLQLFKGLGVSSGEMTHVLLDRS